MKKLIFLILTFFCFTNISFAENVQTINSPKIILENSKKISTSHLENKNRTKYIYYYGDGCGHCMDLDNYFKKNEIYGNYDIVKKEVWYNDENKKDLLEKASEIGIDSRKIGTPFIVIEKKGKLSYISETDNIINYFEDLKNGEKVVENKKEEKSENKKEEKSENKKEEGHLTFLLFFLIPAALGDSINPCAFAVMFILLTSVFSQKKSRKKVLLSGGAFILAIFVSYVLMGFGLYQALASAKNTNILKITAGIIGIIVGLANLKDYFWYGKYFIMEVPTSWRPKMKKLIKQITSPFGAFLIGLIVSLFLLPCTSGPYIAVLGYLSSESANINLWGYIYIFIYNLVFIIPMVIICLIVAFGYKDVAELKEYKELNVERIHLITGIIMFVLGIYILYDALKLYV